MNRQTIALAAVVSLIGWAGSQPATAALVVQYSHEATDPLTDDTGNGYNATAVGVDFVAPVDPGAFAYGLGSSAGSYAYSQNDYMDVPSAVHTPGDDFTVLALVNKNDVLSIPHRTILSTNRFRFQYQTSGTTQEQLAANGQLRLDITGGGGAASGAGTFGIDQWYFAALRYDSSTDTGQAFLTTASQGITTPALTFTPTTALDDITSLRVGRDGLSEIGGGDSFDGQIDQVRFYDQVLTNSQLQGALQRQINPLVAKYDHENAANREQDATGNGYDATNRGNVTYVAPPSPGSLKLGTTAGAYPYNSNGSLDLPSDVYLPGDDFTFAAFVRKSDLVDTGHQTILASDRFRLQWRTDRVNNIAVPGTTQLVLDLIDSDGHRTGRSTSRGSFPVGEWFFVALRYDASSLLYEAFLQSANDWNWGTPDLSFNWTYDINDMSQFRLGGDGLSGIGSTDPFGGWIDEAQIYGAYLSNEQLAQLFQSYIPEPTTLLVWSLLAGLSVGLGWRRRK